MSEVAVFNASGITVPLPKGMFFYDEGPSTLLSDSDTPTSIEERSLEIVIKHNTRYLVNAKGMNPEDARMEAQYQAVMRHWLEFLDNVVRDGRTLAFTRDFGNGKETHIHILYLDRRIPAVNLFTRAHEEYHALTHIPGGVEILEKKIAADRGTSLRFSKIQDEELAADCNGVHTVVQNKMRLANVVKYQQEGGDRNMINRLQRALHIYERGKYGYVNFLYHELKQDIAKKLGRE